MKPKYQPLEANISLSANFIACSRTQTKVLKGRAIIAISCIPSIQWMFTDSLILISDYRRANAPCGQRLRETARDPNLR